MYIQYAGKWEPVCPVGSRAKLVPPIPEVSAVTIESVKRDMVIQRVYDYKIFPFEVYYYKRAVVLALAAEGAYYRKRADYRRGL